MTTEAIAVSYSQNSRLNFLEECNILFDILFSPGESSSARWSQSSVLPFPRSVSLSQLPQVREMHCNTHWLCISLSFQLTFGNQNCNLTVRNRRQARKSLKCCNSVPPLAFSYCPYRALFTQSLFLRKHFSHPSCSTALPLPSNALVQKSELPARLASCTMITLAFNNDLSCNWVINVAFYISQIFHSQYLSV